MNMLYNCKICRIDFEVESPTKKEYTDPIYGPCTKYVAYCPKCNTECLEKPRLRPAKKEQSSMPLFSQNCCGAGTGCCDT